ncbi:epimerase [Candidatus Thiomargarita nelsonii]|uniref:Epimerase n=1 Tax=Candidatus Thiomargarita nelsonii TaxID=1003181 RepID=A0A0A6P5P0_9GAMM|nr:epimerase [Candidatus Thiomargarita nelsonii]
MKVLFTGASSFSGYWFVRELAAAGYEVFATFRGELEDYSGIRRRRIDNLLKICQPVWSCHFGRQKFIELIESEGKWDLFCHHAATVENYKSIDFNVPAALENNTHNFKTVLASLAENNLKQVVLTGTFSEQNEGVGNLPLRAFSPYSLSKGLTAQVFEYYCEILKLPFGKFVMPNPFGPFEEARFTDYLVKSWVKGEVPLIKTPVYVRDNMHVSLLALIYSNFVTGLSQKQGDSKINPSGYVESQGAFAKRFADEMRSRLNLNCELRLGVQVEFLEPLVRIHTDIPDIKSLGWNETQAWDELADYYKRLYLQR